MHITDEVRREIADLVPTEKTPTRYENDSRVTPDGSGGFWVQQTPTTDRYHVKDQGVMGWTISLGGRPLLCGDGSPAIGIASPDKAIGALIGDAQ